MTKYYTPRMDHTVLIYEQIVDYKLVKECKNRQEAADYLGISLTAVQQKLTQAQEDTPKKTKYLVTRTKK